LLTYPSKDFHNSKNFFSNGSLINNIVSMLAAWLNALKIYFPVTFY
jgi:hypothetical protein